MNSTIEKIELDHYELKGEKIICQCAVADATENETITIHVDEVINFIESNGYVDTDKVNIYDLLGQNLDNDNCNLIELFLNK